MTASQILGSEGFPARISTLLRPVKFQFMADITQGINEIIKFVLFLLGLLIIWLSLPWHTDMFCILTKVLSKIKQQFREIETAEQKGILAVGHPLFCPVLYFSIVHFLF